MIKLIFLSKNLSSPSRITIPKCRIQEPRERQKIKKINLKPQLYNSRSFALHRLPDMVGIKAPVLFPGYDFTPGLNEKLPRRTISRRYHEQILIPDFFSPVPRKLDVMHHHAFFPLPAGSFLVKVAAFKRRKGELLTGVIHFQGASR